MKELRTVLEVMKACVKKESVVYRDKDTDEWLSIGVHQSIKILNIDLLEGDWAVQEDFNTELERFRFFALRLSHLRRQVGR